MICKQECGAGDLRCGPEEGGQALSMIKSTLNPAPLENAAKGL
jgi:hypothetical protein